MARPRGTPQPLCKEEGCDEETNGRSRRYCTIHSRESAQAGEVVNRKWLRLNKMARKATHGRCTRCRGQATTVVQQPGGKWAARCAMCRAVDTSAEARRQASAS